MPDEPCKWCGENDCDCQERVDCKKAGEVGHWMCGWCTEHNKPRFQCGCLVKDGYLVKRETS